MSSPSNFAVVPVDYPSFFGRSSTPSLKYGLQFFRELRWMRKIIFLLIAGAFVTSAASGITLTWNDNSVDETGFSVERSRDGVVFAEVATVSANITAYTDSGLALGTYWYRVRAFKGTTYSSYSDAVGVMITTAPSTPALPLISSQPANVTAGIGASASFAVTGSSTVALFYQWKKNGIDIAGATASTFTIASVQTQDAGSYTVAVSNSAGSTLSQSATLSPATATQVVQLTGTVISSASWGNLAVYSGAKAFDGDPSTFFAGQSTDAFVYVGQDFGTTQVVQSIEYFPRPGLNGRMNGGRFRGANRADLADAVTLYTIPSTPPDGQWQTVTLPSTTAAYRYVFYTTDSSNYGDVAEMKFYGNSTAPQSSAVSYLTGNTISSAAWGNLPVYGGAKVFDGDPATFFSGQYSDQLIYVGLDLGSSYSLDAVSFYPRAGLSWRMNGGKFCGANRADLSDAVTLYTIPATPGEGKWTDVTLPVSTAGYRYVFYTTVSANYGDVAEIEFFGKPASTLPTLPSSTIITGTTISSAAWGDIATYSGTKVFDNDTTTFFAGKQSDSFVYVGQDFGSAKQVGVISFFPRPGLSWRMKGGRFCGANKADLSDSTVLYSVASAPPEGVWQTVTLNASTASYRYVFYTTDPFNGADIAELIFKTP